MKSNRMSRYHAPLIAAMILSMAAATAEATDNTAGTDAASAAANPATPQKVGQAVKKLIINGRMPVAVVYLVRHGRNKDEATKALADMFGTTVGKIDDIKKGRNFAYVDENFRPTEAQKQEALDWLKKHPYYDASGVDKIVSELDLTDVATAEQAAAFEAARVKARGQLTVTKEGETADAGGGNRRKPRNKKEAKVEGGTAAEPAAAATGDALLS